MSWITEEEMNQYIEKGYTCYDCTFMNDCADDEICQDFTPKEEDK